MPQRMQTWRRNNPTLGQTHGKGSSLVLLLALKDGATAMLR